MTKYFPEQTKMSEALYQFIILLSGANNPETFLNVVDNVFATMLEIEQIYIGAIEEKDKIFKEHSEMMNRVL